MGLFLKHLQIVGHRIGQLLIVPAVRMIDIPICFAVIIPDVRDHAIPEVGVIHHLLAEQVRKTKQQIVYITRLAIQYCQPQSAVLICDAGGNKLDFCPIHLVQPNIAGPAYEGGVRVLDRKSVV